MLPNETATGPIPDKERLAEFERKSAKVEFNPILNRGRYLELDVVDRYPMSASLYRVGYNVLRTRSAGHETPTASAHKSL